MLSNPSPKRDHKLKKALVPAFTPHNGIDISPSDDDSLEKDETEERLENLIFGDDSGFHEALKSHGHGQTDLVRRKSSDAEGGSDSQGELRDNSALEGLEDADVGVCGASGSFRLQSLSSFSFSTLVPYQSKKTLSKLPLHRTAKTIDMVENPRHGKTAMTNESWYHSQPTRDYENYELSREKIWSMEKSTRNV